MRRSRPNILLVMSDQHNRRFSGCYGNSLVQTPNLDRLAAEGMLFSSAYCPSPLCVPSRMSFLSGLMPSEINATDNQTMLPEGVPTWGRVLSDAGYRTALIGRMHFTGSHHGFDARILGDLDPSWHNVPNYTCNQKRAAVEKAGKGVTQYQWYDRQVVSAACAYLREEALNDGGKPFAASVGFLLPHCPFVAPRELFDYYYGQLGAIDRAGGGNDCGGVPEIVAKLRRRFGLAVPVPPEKARAALAAYCGMCTLMDSNLGEILDCLRETGLEENTCVVYCSDHGESAGEHGCWFKSNYYESSAGVPLIFKWPGVAAPGSVNGRVCNLVDMAPTFAAMASAGPVAGFSGRPMTGLLEFGNEAEWKDETFSEMTFTPGDAGETGVSRMLRRGGWKIWMEFHPDEQPPVVFNLRDDPDEKTNLAGEAGFSRTLSGLRAALMSGWEPGKVIEGALRMREERRKTAVSGRAPDMKVRAPADIDRDVEWV